MIAPTKESLSAWNSIYRKNISETKFGKMKLSRMQFQKNKPPTKMHKQVLPCIMLIGKGWKFHILYLFPRAIIVMPPQEHCFFFHGGVDSDTAAFTIDPQTRFEPIFAIGDSTNSIVIYPFQKGNPGWKNYKFMSAVISTILAEVKLRYCIDTDRMYLGGLSMGGNVSYQFAQEQQRDFRAFYAISAKPKIAEVSHSIYSLHAKDDSLYRYEDLLKVRQKVKKQQKKWVLRSVPKGGHGFMYLPMGGKSTLEFFRMMFNKEEE